MREIKFTAFTLAEVLITLGIIGIIANMTIPTLIMDIKAQEISAKAKEANQILSNALGLLKVNDSDLLVSTISKNRADAFETVLKVDSKGQNAQGVAPLADYRYYNSSTHLAADDMVNMIVLGYVFNDYYLRLQNGMVFNFISGADCIAVDTNGKKPPNMIGKDMIYFTLIKREGVYHLRPYGNGTNCNSFPGDVSSGLSCTADYILNVQ